MSYFSRIIPPLCLTAALLLPLRTSAADVHHRATTAAAVTTPSAGKTPTPQPLTDSGYWHTAGTRIVDAHGRTVRIAAVTWYGMESTYWVPAGLDYQPYTKIMALVRRLGFNTIRLPYSDQLVSQNPVVTQGVKANREFRGKRALTVLDALVAEAHRLGLKIILDDHRSQAATPRMVNHLGEPLWYTKAYAEATWIRDLQTLAKRYRGNDAVIGIDLRNEPHTAGPGPWSLKTYLKQGATWGPYKGIDNPKTDWRLGAERGGNAVLGVNPHLLVFVEGVQLYPQASKPRGVETYWWGSILAPVSTYPVVLKVAHQLVYSAHDWGPRKSPEPWFKSMTFASLHAIWYHNWAFIEENTKAKYAAPVFIGEFGTCTNSAGCIDDTHNTQAQWLQLFLEYLRGHPGVGWDFWALDGSNSNDHAADNGLLNPSWTGVANATLEKALASVQR
jgi:endoglucanase